MPALTEKKGCILIIDDSQSNLDLLETLLSDRGYTIRTADGGQPGLDLARTISPDLILLDIMMPMMNGYEVCLRLKEDPQLRDIPVIFISALDDIMEKVTGFKVGGVDYIAKPFQLEEIIARVETHLELRWKRWEVEHLREWERNYYQKLMELKDELMSTASHNIKNPVSNILGGIHLLRKSEKLSPKGEKYVEMIERGAERISSLITDMLDVAWVEAGLKDVPETLHVKAFLQPIVEHFTYGAQKKNLTLQFTPPSVDFSIRVVPSRMSQAVENLLSNAVKYTPSGGRIEVTADLQDENVLIRVTDTGLGIPVEDLPHIFDKFYRVQRREHLDQPGSGLGMTIVQTIVTQHNGRVEVESKEGQGSTFTIVLPA